MADFRNLENLCRLRGFFFFSQTTFWVLLLLVFRKAISGTFVFLVFEKFFATFTFLGEGVLFFGGSRRRGGQKLLVGVLFGAGSRRWVGVAVCVVSQRVSCHMSCEVSMCRAMCRRGSGGNFHPRMVELLHEPISEVAISLSGSCKKLRFGYFLQLVGIQKNYTSKQP